MPTPTKQSTEQAARCAACIALLSDLDGPPMTARERVEHDQRCAQEMARAEARRHPSPEMELDLVLGAGQ